MDPSTMPRASILLVDDNPANLVALEAILAPLGQELVTAPSGEEALREVLRHEFALILLDVQLTGMNGLETAALIKRHPRCRTVPIIFITAIGGRADHVFRGYSQGAVDYLVKPFNPDILRSKASVFVDLYLQGEKLKIQERLLREHERAMLERKNQERYRQLLDAMPQCIWAADARGRITYWNQAGLEYCGLRADQVTEESFWECLHPDDRPEAYATFERTLHGGTPLERQVRLKRAADGVYRWHLVRVIPERDDDGAVRSWIATATDIDNQKKAEEALANAIVLRDDFLSVASHELKTPLTTLKLDVTNVLRLARQGTGDKSAPIVANLRRMDAQAARLNHLIDELLDVSRIAAGRLELELEEVDLAEVAIEAGVRFAEEASRRGAPLHVDAPVPATGTWDRGRLDQVVTNLLSNAVKYGDGKPIEIAVVADDDRAALIVRDNGVGIRPGDHARIFERFQRAVSSSNYGGIGLGLWIVKQIVLALGGSVTVKSRPGAGSTFRVELPRTRTALGAPSEGSPVDPAARRQAAWRAARSS